MEYPPNPTHEFRVQSLAPALVLVLALAALQPWAAIVIGSTPFQLGESVWRVHAFALVLGAMPPVAVEIAIIGAIGLYAGLYRVVLWVSIVSALLVVLLVPLLLLDALDVLQVRGIVPADQVHAYMLSAVQGWTTAAILVPALIWLTFRAYHAGKAMPAIDPDTHLVIGQTPPPA